MLQKQRARTPGRKAGVLFCRLVVAFGVVEDHGKGQRDRKRFDGRGLGSHPAQKAKSIVYKDKTIRGEMDKPRTRC